MVEAGKSAAWGGATAWLPWKMLGYNGRGATGFGKIANTKFFRTLFGLNKTGRSLWKSLGLGNAIGNLAPNWEKLLDKAKPLWDDLKDLWDDFMRWIRSRDPNDMIGPSGFGEARFISVQDPLNYKIRFENAANASAPAQRVIIRHKLDNDLDLRSFRVGSFGFGNFTREILEGKTFLQNTINYVSRRGVFVRMRAGIDVVSGEATWDLQSVDPQTGLSPDNPSVGFLPPNNGSTGEGFVTFSVRTKSDARALSTIDAQARIIFDNNEPIDTPPIFNTIDSASPSVNLSVLEDVMETGTPAVKFHKRDVGSGLRTVDVYYQQDKGVVQPLLTGITDDIALLPLAPGNTYKLLAAAEDNVGNIQKPRLDDPQAFMTIYIPEVKRSCEHLNNCSNRGNCTHLSLCECDRGFYGQDCGLDHPPLEPPILTVRSTNGSEDAPIQLYLSARFFHQNSSVNGTLILLVDGVPTGLEFNRGVREKNRMTIAEKDFGEVLMITQKDFSGTIRLDITAVAMRGKERAVIEQKLLINVEAVADKPTLFANSSCFRQDNDDSISLIVISELKDKDGSESLEVAVEGVPNGYRLTAGREERGTYFLLPSELPGLSVKVNDTFSPFNINVTAISRESSDGATANTTAVVSVASCDSTATKTKTSHLGVVVGSVVGGLLLLLLIAGVVVFSVWYRRKKARDKQTVYPLRSFSQPIYDEM